MPSSPKRGLRAVFVLAALAALTAACGASQVSTPRARVARDLGCTPNRTTVQRLDAPASRNVDRGRWLVSGCGQTAVYLCTYPVRDCWREGEVHPQGGAVAAE